MYKRQRIFLLGPIDGVEDEDDWTPEKPTKAYTNTTTRTAARASIPEQRIVGSDESTTRARWEGGNVDGSLVRRVIGNASTTTNAGLTLSDFDSVRLNDHAMTVESPSAQRNVTRIVAGGISQAALRDPDGHGETGFGEGGAIATADLLGIGVNTGIQPGILPLKTQRPSTNDSHRRS